MVNIRLREFYIFIPLLIAYFFLGLIYPFLLMDIQRFLLFQIFFMLLPGYIFSKWFISENLTRVQRFIFGYPVSMALLFILSWTGKLVHIKYLESLILVFSIVSIYKIIKEGRNEIQSDISLSLAVCILFYTACIIIVYRMFIIPCSPPMPGHPGLYFCDSLWNVGVTWSYIRGFPLQDPKFVGVLFGYQMLKNIYQATVFNFTKILPFNVHFYIEPIFDWFIMVFLIFYGAIKIAKFSIRKAIIFCVGFFFTTSFLGRRLQLNLFVNPLTTYFSLSVFILFVFYIISYMNKQRNLDIVYLIVLFTYFTAAKAMLGMIVLIVLAIIFIFKLFRKNFSYKELLLGFGLFLSALFLKFTIFQNIIHELHYDYDTTTSKAYHLFKQIYFMRNYADIIYPFYRFLSSFVRNLPQYILSWSVLLFFIVLFTNSEFRKKMKEIGNTFIFIFVFFLVTASMMCLFDFPGARIYYIWYAQVVFLLLGVFALDYILDIKNLVYKIISVSLLILSMIVFSEDLIGWIKIGWAGLPGAKERIWDERASINYDEWLAMEWLRKNTEPNQVFLSHRRYYAHEVSGVDLPRFYGYSALSGRQGFVEGESAEITSLRFKTVITERWNLVNKFLSSSNPLEQVNLLKNIQADYFIQSLRFNDKDFSKLKNLKLVYKNNSVNIFKILRD